MTGFLTDRVPLRFLLAFALLLQAVSLVMAQFMQGAVAAFIFGAVMGATNGMARNLVTVSWPSFYGRANLGSIYGFTAAGVVGAALGPIPFGFARDVLGSYEMALFASAGVSLLLGVASLAIQKPHKKQRFQS